VGFWLTKKPEIPQPENPGPTKTPPFLTSIQFATFPVIGLAGKIASRKSNAATIDAKETEKC
jgi:hypothetical protein